MTPAARAAAAIEVLADIEARRRPAPDALKDWSLARRYAGAKDRAAVASLVYDALRRRASASYVMGEGTPRAILAGAFRLRGRTLAEIGQLFSGERFAPAPLSAEETTRLAAADLSHAPGPVAADAPDWLWPSLERAFGEDTVAELAAMTERAPLDLRANALKTTREELAAALAHLGPAETPWSPWGLRVTPGEDGRGPHIQSEPAFLDGLVEIQDEGSQLAALLAAARPGETAIDLCAGGGGKTLALAATMAGQGRLVATDLDQRRLAPIHARLARAGAGFAEVRRPHGREDVLADLDGTADLVLVDAPCTGSGTWRRNPDAKWRVRPGSLAARRRDQETVLDRAARLVRPGGRIAYVTCSLLPEENDEAVSGLLERHPSLAVQPVAEMLAAAGLDRLGPAVRPTVHGLQMTPLRTGTDGFYVALIRRGS
ncbi:MAG: RsmB/NOP family class I SAM-dependent RNA methyltransferase [Methylobacteriaceae bacterium]|nr:RsmB/NOP family class I SAM-dependent RNA methyltransferase [Methylobacteriaceae bacterium]